MRAAACLLAERGYTATSLEDVAFAAGVTKPMIYYHFDSKEGLYWSVVFPLVQEGVRSVQEIVETTPSPIEALLRIVQSAAFRAQDPNQRYMYYQEFLPLSPEMRREVRSLEEKYEQIVTNVIEVAQSQGAVREGDPHLLALFLLGSVARTARWFSSGGRVPPPEFWTTFASLMFDGLLTRSAGPYDSLFATPPSAYEAARSTAM